MAILLKHLDRSLFLPALCLFNRYGPYLDELPADVSVIDLGKRSKWDFLRLIWNLAYTIRATRPDVVLAKLQYANIITAAARKVSRPRIPLVLCEEINLREALPHATYPKLRARLLRWTYREADAVVTPSSGVASVLRSDFAVENRKLNVIPNAIELEHIRELAGETVTHPFLESPEPVVVSVGRLTVQKGYTHLLRAIALVNAKVPCRLLILGDGEKRKELEELVTELGISDKVCFCGFQKNPFKFMSRTRAFVLSSLWESFGNVLIEAMALGLPVISTRAPYGPEDIIQDGETGILVPPGDPKALGEAILRVLTNSDIKRMAEAGFRVAAKYDASTTVKRYETLLFELVDCTLRKQRNIRNSIGF
jgi:glycosyltransferase involved in cell wall biosynthesis